MRTPSRQPSLMEVMGVCLGASSPAGGTIVTSNTAAATLYATHLPPSPCSLPRVCPSCHVWEDAAKILQLGRSCDPLIE